MGLSTFGFFGMIGSAAGYSQRQAAQFKMHQRIQNPGMQAFDEQNGFGSGGGAQREDRVILENAHGTFVLPTPSEMAAERERQETSTSISNLESKLQGGQELSGKELEYLKEKCPDLYTKAVRVAAERKQYRKQLEECRTKEEVQRVQSNRMTSFFNEVRTVERMNIPLGKKLELCKEIQMRTMGIAHEHQKFIKTEHYAKLPEDEEERKRKRKSAGGGTRIKTSNHLDRLARALEENKKLESKKAAFGGEAKAEQGLEGEQPPESGDLAPQPDEEQLAGRDGAAVPDTGGHESNGPAVSDTTRLEVAVRAYTAPTPSTGGSSKGTAKKA